MATHIIFYGGVAGKIMTPSTLNSNSIWIRTFNSGRFASVHLKGPSHEIDFKNFDKKKQN